MCHINFMTVALVTVLLALPMMPARGAGPVHDDDEARFVSLFDGGTNVRVQELAAEVPLPAFPGAEGFGANAAGGRGGRVIQVTNLNDKGPGSLRAAIEARGPRTVVFRVAGTIALESALDVTQPYLTLAGQTAPGGGITLRASPRFLETPLVVRTHDVIVRHVRIRRGKESRPQSGDCLLIKGGSSKVIVDHCSLSWSTDENVDILHDGNSHITIQWCISSEGLANHSCAALSHGNFVSFHHNLLAHNELRNPRFAGAQREDSIVDIVNNVIYDFNRSSATIHANRTNRPHNVGAYMANYVGNYAIRGPSPDRASNLRKRFGYVPDLDVDVPVYLKGNIGPHRPGDHLPEDAILDESRRSRVVAERHPAPPVRTTSAQAAYEEVLANAGCRVPMLDEVDQRIIADVKARTGRTISHPDEVGGWPKLPTGTPYPDGDEDGMADRWEQNNGLDPRNGSDGAKDQDDDGYTNLEEFLNELAGRGQ